MLHLSLDCSAARVVVLEGGVTVKGSPTAVLRTRNGRYVALERAQTPGLMQPVRTALGRVAAGFCGR